MISEQHAYREELEKNKVIAFVPSGNSMWPIIKNRKQSVIVERKTEKLRPMDVALYVRPSGQNVLHRVISCTEYGYIMCGDSQFVTEKVNEDWVFGVMKGFYRGKQYVEVSDKDYIAQVEKWYENKAKRKIAVKTFFFLLWVKNLPVRAWKKLFGKKSDKNGKAETGNEPLRLLGRNAKAAAAKLNAVSEEDVNQALNAAADALILNAEEIYSANLCDVKAATLKGLSASFIDRLTITEKVLVSMAEGLKQIAKLKSPVGETVYEYENKEQGIKVFKRKVPFGVVGIIFESRPNVTADAFGLCLKTKNAVILRGGSEALNTNTTLVNVFRKTLKSAGLPEDAVSVITDSSRSVATEFMRLNEYVDLLIPRGGAGLIKTAKQTATVPLIETGTGNCHVYVDEFANPEMAANVIFNAKTQRYSVCNACESLVIHEKIAEKVLPLIYEKLATKQVEMRLDEQSLNVLRNKPYVVAAQDSDFYTEYCDAVISVKVVDSLESAISHINEHSTHHSEAIITENEDNAEKFLNAIDSACVYHNASTRFSDGFIFGLGAEIGISTQKLHARGPMGLDALTTTKYTVYGNGAVRK